MTFAEFKNVVIARCQALGVADYELYYQTAESMDISAYQMEIDRFSGSLEGGVCFRCIRDGKMGYASTEALTREAAEQIVDQALDNASALEADEPVFLCEGGKTYAKLNPGTLAMPDTDTLAAKVLETQKKLYDADPAVVDGTSAEGVAERQQIAIFNSRGLDLQEQTTLVGLVAAAVVRREEEMANDYRVVLRDLEQINTDALAKQVAASALAQLGGEPAPTGKYPVIFDPDAMSELLGTFAAVFSAENARKGLSRLKDREGEIIAAPLVTLRDDPAYPGSYLQRSFDAEGSPAYPKEIISQGKLNTLLYDLKNAALAGRETTGNASKSGYDAPVSIQPFTLYLTPGSISEEELLAQAGNGVYIHSLDGLHAGANAISGDFSLQSAGFRIENGRKTDRVKSFTVAGNFYSLLENIRAVADNLEFPGMGRVGSPSVLVDGLSVAGK